MFEDRRTFVVMHPYDHDGDDVDIDGQEEKILRLSINDVIVFLDDERGEWMKGQKKDTNEIGWFPKSRTREGVTMIAIKLF